MDCLFCEIGAKKQNAHIVYEDDVVIAFLDINPGAPGHTLIMPKKHYSSQSDIPDDVIGKLYSTAQAMSHILLKALQVEGTTIYVANGINAGQTAEHFMINVIPRLQGDKVMVTVDAKQVDEAQLITIRQQIIQEVKHAFNLSNEQMRLLQ